MFAITNNSMSQRQLYLYGAVSLCFFAYVFVRSITVGGIVDELYTIDLFVHTWVYGAEPIIANNHFLNSFLIKLFSFFFGDSLFVARLPNVLAFLLYLFFSYRITSQNLPASIGVICFVLLSCNPFLLDFFSLARGYGLSFACMMASLYYGIKNFKSYTNTTLTKSLIWAGLSVYAVFSMLYFWTTIVIALTLAVLLRKEWQHIKGAVIRVATIGIGLLSLIAHPIYELVKHKQLYHGGNWNFFEDTMFSLTRYSLFHSDTNLFTHIFLTLGLAVFVLIAGISLYRKRNLFSPRNFVLFIHLFIVLIIIVAHYTAGILHPIDRNAVFFYPLVVLSFCFCLPDLREKLRWGFMSAILVCCIFNFALSANFYTTILWNIESHNREILHKINEEGKRKNKVMNIACHFAFIKSLLYYQEKDSCSYTNIQVMPRHQTNKKIAENTDFYFHDLKEDKLDKDELRLDLSQYNKDTFIVFPKENVIVYKNISANK